MGLLRLDFGRWPMGLEPPNRLVWLQWSFWKREMEPVFGGILRVWRNGGKSAAPFVCAGAGARGWCEFMLHSSISSIGEVKVKDKQLIGRGFQRLREMEAKVATGEGMER